MRLNVSLSHVFGDPTQLTFNHGTKRFSFVMAFTDAVEFSGPFRT